jgi:hypothetical protein
MGRQYGSLCGLAIVLVVLNHVVNWATGTPQVAGWTQSGGAVAGVVLLILGQFGPASAVAVFMFVSGSFVIYATRGNPRRLPFHVALTRVRTMLLPYVIWSLVFYGIIYFQWGSTYTLAGYVKNLLVGYPFHFVPLLVFFYLLSPVLVRMSTRMRWATVALVEIYQLILTNLVYRGVYGFEFPAVMRLLEPPVLAHTLADWGVFFPLGMACSLDGPSVLPLLRKARWVTGGLAAVFFGLACLDTAAVVHFPLGNHLCALAVALFIPTLKRESIPLVSWLEQAGRRSYGIYLMHMIVVDLCVVTLGGLMPWVFAYRVEVLFLLFVAGLFIPLGAMSLAARVPVRQAYRAVFG